MRRAVAFGAARRRAVGLVLALIAAAGLAGPTAAAEPDVLRSAPLRAIDARSAALLMSGQQGGDLDVRLRVSGAAGSGEQPDGRLALVLDVAADGLEPADEQERVPLAIHAYALDPAGRVVAALRQGVRIEAIALAAPWRAGVKFLGHLPLPAGDYRLRVLAVRRDTGAFGIVFGAATVPAAGEAQPAALLLEPAARWLVARQPGAGEDGSAPPPPADSSLVPATEPVVGRAEAARLRLLLRDADPAAGWLARLGGAAERELELEPLDAPDAGGWRAWQARFDGRELADGEYRLELVAPAATEPALSLPVSVVDAAVGARAEGGAVWTDLAGAIAAAAERALPVAAPRGELGLDEVERGYLEAIGRLAAGDEREALGRLLEIEPAALAGSSGNRFERLLQLELQVAADLALVDPECLPPLARLHAQAYDAYLERREPALATRSRQLAVRLLFAYVQERDAPAARELAARAFESIGGRLLKGGNRFEAARIFADAIEMDAGSIAGLQGLALLLERSGQYLEALDYLQRVAARVPDDPEPRLRLALQHLRTGDPTAAEARLRALHDDGVPDWVRTVAVEELVRLLAARGARDEAIGLLEAEIERLPEPGLLLQLAVLVDAAGRRSEAGAILARLESGGFADVESPRQRYDRRLPAELEASNAAFADATRQRRPQLVEAHRELATKLGLR
jgi:tetratricopeptide (TPR) repeat protein